MSYALCATATALLQSPRPRRRPKIAFRRRVSSCWTGGVAGRTRFYLDGRGKFRRFNYPQLRLYRSNIGPPEETDEPWLVREDETATWQSYEDALPFTPDETFADGTWWLSLSFFDGVLDSGFLPLGGQGETFIRLEIVAGEVVNKPPNGPNEWRLEPRAGGVVRVVGLYYQTGALRAGQWALAYTTDESAPPVDDPDVTVAMATSGLAVLLHDLPAQVHETIVKVRLQTRRLDGAAWIYSEGSTVLTALADAQGPSPALQLGRWTGHLPETC